jgi:hypothetical protein
MAIWLVALGALASWAEIASAQPAHSGVQYQTPTPTYENGSAPFAESAPPDHALNPFKPVGFEPEFDWFAPAETSSYGKGPKPNIGYFFSYERLYWSPGSPEKAYVGSEVGPTFYDPTALTYSFFPDGPSVDNRFITSHGMWGNRWELGYTDVDDYGWLVSVLDHVSQGTYRVDHEPAFTFGDPNGISDGVVNFPLARDTSISVPVNVGPLPAIGNELLMKNVLQLNGVELSRFYRARQLHNGAYFEVLYGVRWFNINDTFSASLTGNGVNSETISFPGGPVTGTGGLTEIVNPTTATFPANIFDGTTWSMRANNNLIGPQIGFRLFRQRQRWVTSVAARFVAAANFQNLQLKSRIGSITNINQGAINSNMLTTFRGLGSDIQEYATTFSPMGELRVNFGYNVTRSVSLTVGYTGIIVGNISRASNSINYDAVNLIGIKQNTDQLFWTNGLDFGVAINR